VLGSEHENCPGGPAGPAQFRQADILLDCRFSTTTGYNAAHVLPLALHDRRRRIPAFANLPRSAATEVAFAQVSLFRPRFTIRDLLWLTALMALSLGWWLDHRRVDEAILDNKRLTIAYPVNPDMRPKIIKTLRDAFSHSPNIRVNDDPSAAFFTVEATREEHAAIWLAIKSLEAQN
jgi:hypothetical protein